MVQIRLGRVNTCLTLLSDGVYQNLNRASNVMVGGVNTTG